MSLLKESNISLHQCLKMCLRFPVLPLSAVLAFFEYMDPLYSLCTALRSFLQKSVMKFPEVLVTEYVQPFQILCLVFFSEGYLIFCVFMTILPRLFVESPSL